MTLWTAAAACLLLGLVSTLLTVSRQGRPGPKRTHLFEEDGERANPFADLSAGAEAAEEGCRQCGTALDADAYQFCTGCGGSVVADD